MQTNNLLQFIVVTLAVMETALELFERVDKISERYARQDISERNAQRDSERNARRDKSNLRKRSRNVEHNAQH